MATLDWLRKTLKCGARAFEAVGIGPHSLSRGFWTVLVPARGLGTGERTLIRRYSQFVQAVQQMGVLNAVVMCASGNGQLLPTSYRLRPSNSFPINLQRPLGNTTALRRLHHFLSVSITLHSIYLSSPFLFFVSHSIPFYSSTSSRAQFVLFFGVHSRLNQFIDSTSFLCLTFLSML